MRKHENMDIEVFLNLPTDEVAQLVKVIGPKVCVFPINGTRRWFLAEYAGKSRDIASTYLDAITRRYIEIFQILFDHGIPTLLTPSFGPDLMDRGEEYLQVAAEGFARLVTHADFLAFYREYDVRVRFYGDYRQAWLTTPYAYLSDLFDQLTAQTLTHKRHRLFFGLFAHDASEAVAEIAIRFYQKHGYQPNKSQIVAAYYGEYIEPADLFIGFDRLSAFDMPLISTGGEDLYFTVSPSPYFSTRQWRYILYDHLYSRRKEANYDELSATDWHHLKLFYRTNRENTIGFGSEYKGIWHSVHAIAC